MSENRTPWRDIYSSSAWKKILVKTGTKPESVADLTESIEGYHKLSKNQFDTIDQRIEKLGKVAEAAELVIVMGDLDISKDRKKYDDRDTKAQYITKLGPWLNSLEKRCQKKAAYLRTIQEYYQSNRKAQYSLSAASFLTYLNEVQRRRATVDTNMHLVVQNRMERLDPFHRGGAEFELKDDAIYPTSNPMSQALCAWLDADNKEPFFLWFENHPLCLASPGLDDFWSADHRRVKMTVYGWTMLHFVTIRGTKLCSVSDTDGQLLKELDTSDAIIVKGEVAHGGQYAFVWATDGAIFSTPHKAGTLHHSSFTRGHKVQAAGMWTVTKGKVLYVDDNTGHYHTDAYHLYLFLKFLNDRGVVDRNALVKARTLCPDVGPSGVPGEDRPMRVTKFLEYYSNPDLREQLKAVNKASQLKVGKSTNLQEKASGVSGKPPGITLNVSAMNAKIAAAAAAKAAAAKKQ